MISAIQKLDDGTIKLTITIPSQKVTEARAQVLDDFAKSASVPGFRKGKAPKKIVEEQIDDAKVREEVLKKLLPNTYVEAVKEHDLKPIITPKIHVENLAPDKDWQFTAQTCEAPDVELNGYKDKIKSLTAKSKIVIPGKEPTPVKFDEIVKILLENTSVKIPGIISEGEVDRLLSQTLDEIKKLGLTLDQYLASTNKTPEALKEEYKKKAEGDIKLEFVLQKIAEVEKITVEGTEIEEAINKAKDDGERKSLESNRYLLASILRQQKTLDFLKNL